MLRGSLGFAAVAAALLMAVPASADLRPVRRDFGELSIPRLRAGEIQVPTARARGRVRLIVRLAEPPLAQHVRTFQSSAARRKLDTASATSRAYLARLAASQRRAEAQLRRVIPEATVSRRFRVILNGLAVELPASRLPELLRQSFVTRVYPSVRYTLALNDSPSIIGADAITRLTGARGEGIKIAVVDDGVDSTNPFFDPAGFSYPPGFPKGAARWTSPKVIVARAFPGPNSGRAGRLAVDPRSSFHGTHVAGIAAGDANTTAPSGPDHPPTPGLSGVAPRAWIGNYRVFNVPTPIGHIANTPEIIAAFEAAVSDDMDVINFSGGGAQTDPATDAFNEAIRNIVAAGVVVVSSAGNDRDDFGFGTAGSPATAPDAISVAATSNSQVFAPALSVVAPGVPAGIARIPFVRARGTNIPAEWNTLERPLVDVGTIVGRDGAPVDRLLCAPGADPNAAASTLPAGSLSGAIALASRGRCTFVSKAARARAAGAIGLVLVDNRPGEANPIPVALAVPGGMISDFDGTRLRAFMATTGGRVAIRITSGPERIETGRGGVVTSFSSAGPTAFGHLLKPDVAAPGGQILSATLRNAGGPFAVFDGTSMSSPHVAGATALLLQLHRGWTPRQVKSALVATAGPAWVDTARTVEAPVVLQGGGLVNLPRANDPKLFTHPVSLSFGDLNVNRGARSEALLLRVSDAGDGAGTWQVELHPQLASAGASISLPPAVTLAPGGETEVPVVVRAPSDAAAGDNFGFVVLRRGDVTRRVPYLFAVTRPALQSVRATPLRRLQTGDTLSGPSRVSQYRWPASPFGHPPTYLAEPPMRQDGAERLYVTRLNDPAVNIGVSIVLSSGASQPDPWFLGSPDENDVQGYAGTPVNVNPLTFSYRADLGVAGAALPRPKTYYVSVDAGRDPFTGRLLSGRYLLRSWVNDVVPPLVLPVTTRVSTGRPTLVARVVDGAFGEPASGVDPLSLVIGYRRVLVGAAAYDPISGIAVFPLPREAPALRSGRMRAVLAASDLQEAKNVNVTGPDPMPNTAVRPATLRVVAGPTVTWLAPERNECATARTRLVAVAGSPARVRSVRFFDGSQTIGSDNRGAAGVFAATWRTRGEARGRHVLRAVVVDSQGREAQATRIVRICRR